MRLSLVFVLSALGLCAQEQGRVVEFIGGHLVSQVAAEGAVTAEANQQEQARLEKQTAQSASKLAEFKRKLTKATRALGLSKSRVVVAPQGACSTPLSQVGSAANFRSNMRILTPGTNAETSAFERAPKAPPCEEQANNK